MKDVIFIKSLEAKLTLTRETIPFYQSLKEVCAVHEGVTSRISFQRESIYFNKKKVAIIKVSRKNISIYLALDPVTHNEFGVKDVTDKKSSISSICAVPTAASKLGILKLYPTSSCTKAPLSKIVFV